MRCPYCGSEDGYYMMETVWRALFFDFDSNPVEGTEDYAYRCGKRRYCMHCQRILPRKMFENPDK